MREKCISFVEHSFQLSIRAYIYLMGASRSPPISLSWNNIYHNRKYLVCAIDFNNSKNLSSRN